METSPSLPLQIGLLLFPDFELLDAYGPLELLGALEPRPSLFTIAETPGIIHSHQGPKTIADCSWHAVKTLDILLVPGGQGVRKEIHNADLINALKSLASQAKIVASVCTGSALLAKAGLLDKRRATSNKQAFAWVSSQSPSTHWVQKARWVKDDLFFTSSGVSAGMDMTLAMIAQLFGRAESLRIARYAEYLWNENPDNDPFFES